MIEQPQNDQLLNFKEAIAYLRTSRSTVYRLMWSGRLPGHKVGSTYRFYKADLDAAIEPVATMYPLPDLATFEQVV